jgi:hypothetical protein
LPVQKKCPHTRFVKFSRQLFFAASCRHFSQDARLRLAVRYLAKKMLDKITLLRYAFCKFNRFFKIFSPHGFCVGFSKTIELVNANSCSVFSVSIDSIERMLPHGHFYCLLGFGFIDCAGRAQHVENPQKRRVLRRMFRLLTKLPLRAQQKIISSNIFAVFSQWHCNFLLLYHFYSILFGKCCTARFIGVCCAAFVVF